MTTTKFDAVDRERPVPRDVLARAKRAAHTEYSLRRRARVVVEHLCALGRTRPLDPVDQRSLALAWQVTMARPLLPEMRRPLVPGR